MSFKSPFFLFPASSHSSHLVVVVDLIGVFIQFSCVYTVAGLALRRLQQQGRHGLTGESLAIGTDTDTLFGRSRRLVSSKSPWLNFLVNLAILNLIVGWLLAEVG